MAIFSVLFLILAYWQVRGLEDTVQSLAVPAQKFCQSLFHLSSNHLHFYKAVSCGTPLKESYYDVLKIVSLWHLIIVSAGHFNLVLWILKKMLPSKPSIAILALSLFTLWTGAQPPVVRAFGEYFVKNFSKRVKLWFPPAYSTLYSACLILILFPSWTSSWSFLLSWLCGIMIQLLDKKSLLLQSLGIAIGVFPIVCTFSTPHPLGFLFNWILGPPMAVILFPLSLLLIPFPFLHYLTDPLLDTLLFILHQFMDSTHIPSLVGTSSPQYMIFCWIYLLILQWVILRWKPQ